MLYVTDLWAVLLVAMLSTAFGASSAHAVNTYWADDMRGARLFASLASLSLIALFLLSSSVWLFRT